VKFELSTALARITPGRPLVITDADGVILQFTAGFEHYLERHGFYLDMASYRLHGNIKRRDDRTAILDVEATVLIEDFRADLDSLEAVNGAREALAEIARSADIVVLSNVNAAQAAARERNLRSLDLDYPLIANDGPKGRAVRALAARAGARCFFIDDVPMHLADAAKVAPEVYLLHLAESARLRELITPSSSVHCFAADWDEARRFILENL
jgi:hypothetical protein